MDLLVAELGAGVSAATVDGTDVTGFLTAEGEVWGRPVGVAVSPDGALFVSEDGNGTIWKVSRD